MIESTCSRRDAASVIFNLPDHHVIDAVDLPSWGCRVIAQADSVSDGCSDRGVVSERVHAWCRQRFKDIPHTDGVELILVKPRLVCGERACPRRTFTQTTPELPLRARCTSRLRRGVLEAVIDHGRPVAGVAAGFGIAWWTVHKSVNAAVDVLLGGVDDLHVRRLGIDEHRYRRVRWFRDPDTGGWRRVEPWMTALVNAASGQVLGIVDGRGPAPRLGARQPTPRKPAGCGTRCPHDGPPWRCSSPTGSPTRGPKPRTPRSNTSGEPAAATATTPTTKPVSYSEAPTGRGNTACQTKAPRPTANSRFDTLGGGNGQGGGAIINATTNPERPLDPRSLLPGQNDDWVMYPLDEFAITTVTEVITDLVASAGISLDLDPADLITNWGAETDADLAVADEAAAKESSSLRLKPGVIHRAPRLLLKILRHNPNRWRWEERSFRNRLGRLQQRAAQAGSLNDEDLLALVGDITGLFQECLHDGAMYYGLGLVWMYWRTARLLRKRSNAGGELTENVAAYFLQLLLTDQKNPLSPLFEQFRKLSADTQEVDLQAFVVSIPDSAFMTANTSRDIEKTIFKKLRALPKGQQIETQVDALLADLPVAPEAVDWPFSPRPQLPFRLLVALLSSEPIEGLDELLTDEDAAKQVAKKLPFRKRPPWRWNVAKTRGLMAGAVGTVFLLLEIVPVLQRALSEVAQRLLRRRQVEVAEDLMLLRFDDILKALVDQADRQDLVLENHHAHIKKLTARRRARQLEAKETKTLR